VREALAMLDREGQQRFSVRRLAGRLGVTPMAVYNHVSGKRDLLQAVADAVVDGIDYGEARGNWRQTIAACFRTLRAACLAHPGAVALIESADELPPGIFRPMEITVSALRGAGLGPRDALRAYFVLTTFTLGQVRYQTQGWARGVDADAAVREGRIDRRSFPTVVGANPPRPWDFDRAFEFGVSVILDGLESQIGRTGAARRSASRRRR
jgi:TetR/AcrR family tetracycline transcriptional repressor